MAGSDAVDWRVPSRSIAGVDGRRRRHPASSQPVVPLAPSAHALGGEERATMPRSFTLDFWMDDGGYVGRLREVPNVFSQGESLEELKTNIQDAYRLMMEGAPPLPVTTFDSTEVTVEEHVGPTKQETSIVELLAMPEAADVEFDPPRLLDGACRPADLS